jgi:hypothetical protein
MPTLQEILDNPDLPWVYLLYVNALVDATPTTRVVRFSAGAKARTTFGDPQGQYFPFLTPSIQIATHINPLGLGERADTSYGVVQIGWSPDGQANHDDLANLAYDGRLLIVYLGLPTDDLVNFNELFRGYAETVYFDESKFSIVLRDPQARFDVPIQANLYLGDSSTYEGDAQLEDVPKPLCFGTPLNVTPVPVSGGTPGLLIYQVHDGEIKAITNVYDRGEALINAGDITDPTPIADLSAWTPVLGEYKTDLARGCFRLGAQPQGQITCDVDGDNDCPDVTFPQTAAEIVRRIAKRHGGLVSGDLDSASFTQLDTDAPYTLSLYTGTQNPTIAQVIDKVLGSVGGYRYTNRSGDLVVGQMRFRTSTRTIDYAQGHIASLRMLRGPQAAKRVTLGYERKWTVQSRTDFTGGTATENFMARRSQEYLFRFDVDATTASLHALARVVRAGTLLDASNDAGDEAARQLVILKSARIFEVQARREQFQIDPGETITIQHPRYGFAAGKDAVVLSVVENTGGVRPTVLRVAVVD